jgi:hypothetical protein
MHTTLPEFQTMATLLPREEPSLDDLPSLPLATGGLEFAGLLGEGGVGRVHSAHQPMLDRDVAVKRLKHGSPEVALAKLLHEARVMGCLEHPNIPPVHALGVDADSQPVLVMKRVEGSTWDVEAHTLEENLRILEVVAGALAHAHTRGIVHRDLKPDNVMLGLLGETYVMDWGIAVDVGRPTGLAGTPLFMAPEMFGPSVAHPSMDVFTVGALLHLLLSGEPRHPGPSLEACREAAGREVALPDHADAELAELVTLACQVDSDARPSMAALHAGVRDWLRNRGAVRLAEVAEERLEVLTRADSIDPTVLTECLFAIRQALVQRPAHAPYVARLRQVLELAAEDAIARDVRLESAAGWLSELEVDGPHPLRAALAQSRDRASKQASLAYDADYQVNYTRRARIYAQWFGVFAVCAFLAALGGWGNHSTYSGAFVLAVLFHLTLLGTLWRNWGPLTANLANRATLGGFLVMSTLLLFNRGAGWALGIPLQWVFIVDGLLLGSITLTLGFTYGRVTRFIGGGLLAGSVVAAITPPHLAGTLFVGALFVILAFFLVAVRSGFARTIALRRPKT